MAQSHQDVPPLTPPEEAFWQRYSRHHEFSLSSASSVAVFGLGLGLIVFIGFLANLARNDVSRKPPQMDAVEIEGGGGTDGAAPAGSGGVAQGKEPRAEATEETPRTRPEATQPDPLTPKLKTDLRTKPLDVPKIDPPNKVEDSSQEGLFDEVTKEARKEVEKAKKALQSGGTPGVLNPGKDGGTGGGTGKGIGAKVGEGGGTGDSGKVFTKHQRREMRWRIDFSGSGEDHLIKLRALKVTLAFPNGRPNQYLLMDLTRTPPVGIINNLAQQRDKVKWFNTSPLSLRDLARVLHLGGVPPLAIIFLPPDVEEEMQQLEHDYKGLEEHQIALTEFEIQRRGDRFVPVVVGQRQR